MGCFAPTLLKASTPHCAPALIPVLIHILSWRIPELSPSAPLFHHSPMFVLSDLVFGKSFKDVFSFFVVVARLVLKRNIDSDLFLTNIVQRIIGELL